jgi:hypothetical protein
MENKYYTPSIEEFRVGFIYEQVSINPQEDITVSDEFKYEQHTFPDPFVGYRLDRLNLNNIRVKYLDKQDIESLGWEFNYLGKDDWFKGNIVVVPYNEIDYPFELWFKLDKYWLGFYNAIYKIVILEKGDDFLNGQTIRFSGNCPSINELKYIQKLLGIK